MHHLPAVYQQVGLDPTSLDGTLPHCLASFLLLSLPALLALGAHGVTHYVVRVTHHLRLNLQALGPPAAAAGDSLSPSADDEAAAGNGGAGRASAGGVFLQIRQQVPRIAAVAARVGADMTTESAQAAWSYFQAASQAASRQVLASLRGPASLAKASTGPSMSSATSPLAAEATAGSSAMSGLGVVDMGSRQQVPTAAVAAAVSRGRPPQAFLQLAYAYLPLVWAGTLTHYLPAFLLRAGRILPVRPRTHPYNACICMCNSIKQSCLKA